MRAIGVSAGLALLRAIFLRVTGISSAALPQRAIMSVRVKSPPRRGRELFLDLESVKKAYRRYAPVYDALFGPVLHQGRKRIVQGMDCRPGERILEVGLGTGLSLPLYPDSVKITGIDVSSEMLERARERVERRGLTNVEAIRVMDAMDMDFPDAGFDKTVVMYVVSVVDDVCRLVSEIRRVTKPGGEIFIVNHFRSEKGVARRLEDGLSPLAKLLGFHTDLELSAFLAGTGLDAESVTPVNLFGYWKLVRCRLQ